MNTNRVDVIIYSALTGRYAHWDKGIRKFTMGKMNYEIRVRMKFTTTVPEVLKETARHSRRPVATFHLSHLL